MANESSTIVQKLWNYCNVLRDAGVSYDDYVEQLTYLLFLKMVEEQNQLPTHLGKRFTIDPKYSWEALRSQDGDALESQYRHTLENLGKEKGLLGAIFRKSQNKIQDPTKLKRLIELINSETWIGLNIDVKGEFYEGLLQKNAEIVKSSAGQYFTPRALIQAIVEVMQPEPGQRICDPACGSGGFLLAANDFINSHHTLDQEVKHFLNNKTFRGVDIADGAVKLYLHGITDNDSLVETKDSLIADPNERFDLVLANPPFGSKSSITYQQEDFWATTSNTELNFLQHVKTLLKINGKAVVVVPDNVLFEGGAGETIRKKLLHECDVHTLLRLPTGIFYAQGVKTNVLFFDKKPDSPAPKTEKLWIYDFRTNQHFTLKTHPLEFEDLQDFIQCFNPENRHDRQETERFRAFTYEEITKLDKVSLDIFWLNDDNLEKTNNLQTQDVSSAETSNKSETETLNSTVQLVQQLDDVVKKFNMMMNPEVEVDKCINQIRQQLKESLKKVTDASDSKTKGSTLEDFTQELFGCLNDLKFHKKNSKNATGEIDVIFTIKKTPWTLFAEFSDLLIVECKNWNKPVGADEIRIFLTKMRDFDCKVGIVISKNGISGDDDYIKNAKGVIRNHWLKDRIIIIVLNLKDLESIVNGNGNLYTLLKEKYFSVKLMNDN